MKFLYLLFFSLLSAFGISQTILHQPEVAPRTVQDPSFVVLGQGFKASSDVVSPFVAKIGPANAQQPGGGPADSNAGINNPSGTVETPTDKFHDTQGNLDVTAAGQLQFSLPIALPPGVKSVAPQISLVYTSGSGNSLAGYGWNLSGITSISRVGRNIEQDGAVRPIQLDYSDYYTFNGQRLILKSGEYGKDGAEYVTEKYSNIKIRSVGSISGEIWKGPEFWEVTFEDGSQAWYGSTGSGINAARSPLDYNIVKWQDAQSNTIIYNYAHQNNVSRITSIEWGGNTALNKPNFNKIEFSYHNRTLKEASYIKNVPFIQAHILNDVKVLSESAQFKKYEIIYHKKIINGDNTKLSSYEKVKEIVEYNSAGEAANPIKFESPLLNTSTNEMSFGNYEDIVTTGDFNGDGLLDFIVNQPAQNGRPAGYYMYFDTFNNISASFVYLGSASNYLYRQLLAFTIHPGNNYIQPKQGLVIVKNNTNGVPAQNNIEVQYYSIKIDGTTLNTLSNALVLEYSKTISAGDLVYNESLYPTTNYPAGYTNSTQYSVQAGAKEVDINSDGLSELVITIQDSKSFAMPASGNGSATPCIQIGPDQTAECWTTRILGYRYFVIDWDDLQNNTHHVTNYSSVRNIMGGHVMDLDNDGVPEILQYTPAGPTDVTYYTTDEVTGQTFSKTSSSPTYNLNLFKISKVTSQYNINFSKTYHIKGLAEQALYGDLNGDKNIEILVPLQNEENNQTYVTGWAIYLNTGSGMQEAVQGLMPNAHDTTGTSIYYNNSALIDVDNDGKAEIINSGVHYSQNANIVKFWTNLLSEAQYNGNDPMFKWTFVKNKVFDLARPKMIASPIIGDFRIGTSSPKVLFLLKNVDNENRYLFSYNHYSVEETYTKIKQGGLTTVIEYKGIFDDGSDFYKPVRKEQYPFFEFEENRLLKVVSEIRQTWGDYLGQKRKRFLYRGLIGNLHGRGVIGFRQTARSSWDIDAPTNLNIWNGQEIDPLNLGLSVKEWTIKTDNAGQVFPANISENNNHLLTYKSTTYQVDKLFNGQVVTSVTEMQKPKIVTAALPISSFSKDFLTNVTSSSTVNYGAYYLPVQSIQNVNNGYGITTSTFEYIHNASGTGPDYFIGRPKSKEDQVQAYGDSKSAKQEFTYENNLVKTVKNWNRDNSGFLTESYSYDAFGNVVQKSIGNSVNSQTQNSNSFYDPKGRFVIKKTDNIGLETNITYNDWGLILNQTDPLGNTLTNTYDAWGKVLKSKTNISGVTTYKYEKLAVTQDTKVTQYSPDGQETVTYTNPLGHNYKNSVKALEQGVYVSTMSFFDPLGRKMKESEPYFEGQLPNQWNNFVYDDSIYPTKVTATSFIGKEVETAVSGNVTTVKELNGYSRTTSKTTDALGNVIAATDKGGTVIFSYNAAGEQTQAQYEQNIVTTEYDVWGRKSRFNDPSNGEYKYEYNVFGQPTKITSPKGKKEFTYNAFGQLISQTEISSTNTSTNKTISFTYDNKGRLISKSGMASGKSFSSAVVFDPQGRVLSTSESGNNRYFIQKGITYDDKGRVVSYEKSLYSGGVLTKANIENEYNDWNGEMFRVKDLTSGTILSELQDTNAEGQVLKSKLGTSELNNYYDGNGFLTSVNHSSSVKPGILQVSYAFNAIKNELTARTTGGDYNIIESFSYDDNNRLISWTNPVTGQLSSNSYDHKGRILENDQVGTIKYENGSKIYQATGMTLNPAGEQNYTNDLIQQITYNENNDPVFIDGLKGDVAFQYGLTNMRQRVTYGGNFNEAGEGTFTKFYSEDGSFEVSVDNITGKEKHVLYIGGSPYESNIIFLKNYDDNSGSYRFLHKDYLGSVLAVTDEAGNKLEQRHFDAWGNFTHLQFGSGTIITDRDAIANSSLILERGYTSHEHLFEVGIIHMNGRLYDPLLRRFLNADEHIQDPHNTQNYNKYGYVFNNPLMYNDPSGEIVPLLVAVAYAAVIGAAVGLAAYSLGALISGQKWTIGGALKATFFGAVSGAVTCGIGSIYSAATGVYMQIGRALMHGFSQAILSSMQGTASMSTFIAGFAGSVGVAAFKEVGGVFAQSAEGMVLFGALSGGVGSELSGGNFWQGAMIGGIVAGLNHGMHRISNSIEEKSIAERELNAVGIEDINATAPNTQASLDKVLSTDTLSSMHKKSGNVGITFGTPSNGTYLAETIPNAGSTRATGIMVNQSKTFSYFKLYGTLGHELTHAIDYMQGTALSIFRNYYKQNPKTAQTKYDDRLEYRAYQWELKYAPSVLGTQWYNYYQSKYSWK